MCEDIFKTYPDWVNRAAIAVPNYFEYVDNRPWPLDKKKRAKRAGQAQMEANYHTHKRAFKREWEMMVKSLE